MPGSYGHASSMPPNAISITLSSGNEITITLCSVFYSSGIAIFSKEATLSNCFCLPSEKLFTLMAANGADFDTTKIAGASLMFPDCCFDKYIVRKIN